MSERWLKLKWHIGRRQESVAFLIAPWLKPSVNDDPEPFRYCHFCGADCDLEEPQHRDDCPSVTGIFPVEERDYRAGISCGVCGKQLFTQYRHVQSESFKGDGGIPVYEVACDDCAIQKELIAGG